jgi:hypothetical protein
MDSHINKGAVDECHDAEEGKKADKNEFSSSFWGGFCRHS